MSLGSVPQRLFGRLLGRGQPSVTPDDPMLRMIARTAGRIKPGRAYRWRLRGRLVNQYVAVREGLAPAAPRRPARMGSLGRAVLFASVGLAISVSAVGAASTSALPGDPLYAVKRQVEELRMEIAPPSVRPALAAMALEERLAEVEQLAAAGDWTRVALGEAEVDGAVAMLRGLGAPLTAEQVADLTHHTQVLTALLARAPAAAQPGLERALLASSGVAATTNPGKHLGQGNVNGGSGTASGGNSGGGGSGGGGANGTNSGGGKPTGDEGGTSATPSASPLSESQAPHPHNSPAPQASPRPAASASPKSESTPPAH
jgi:uncharacterized membrane protein YgcG